MRSYPIVWRENGFRGTGKLELLPGFVELDGVHGSRRIALEEIVVARPSQRPERIEGRPSLILELRKGPPIAISPVAQPGAVTELADRFAALVHGLNGAAANGSAANSA
jgi:hypothetical protein